MHAGSKINVHCMHAPYWGKLEQSPCVHHYFLKCVKFIIHFFLAVLFVLFYCLSACAFY